MQNWVPFFLDELTKVSASLNKSERQRQALQFGALGALSGPVIGAAGNLIQRGKILPGGVKSIPRWLAGTMATGAVLSGAIPVVRHGLERNIQQEANDRARMARRRAERRAERRALAATPAVKKASTAGQDLRLPVTGGTKFPTADSTSFAQNKLQKSMAEVGPMAGISPGGAKLDDYVPAPKPKQKWSSVGGDMSTLDPISNDPLVCYLKKTAKESYTPPLTGLVNEEGTLKDNEENLPLNTNPGMEISSRRPCPTKEMKHKGVSEAKLSLDPLFDGNKGRRRKFLDKEKPFTGFDKGVIDRVLGS